MIAASKILRKLGGKNRLPHLACALAEVLEIMRIKVAQNLFDFLVETRIAQNIAIGFGGDGKPIGHFDAFARELPAHLAQRSILAADERDVIDADLVKPKDVFGPLFAGSRDRCFQRLRCHGVSFFRC